jgi:hypothetical protein
MNWNIVVVLFAVATAIAVMMGSNGPEALFWQCKATLRGLAHSEFGDLPGWMIALGVGLAGMAIAWRRHGQV